MNAFGYIWDKDDVRDDQSVVVASVHNTPCLRHYNYDPVFGDHYGAGVFQMPLPPGSSMAPKRWRDTSPVSVAGGSNILRHLSRSSYSTAKAAASKFRTPIKDRLGVKLPDNGSGCGRGHGKPPKKWKFGLKFTICYKSFLSLSELFLH